MLRRVQWWSRLPIALLAMMASMGVLALSTPCDALTPAVMPASAPVHREDVPPCCEHAPPLSQGACPFGCRAQLPTAEPPIAPMATSSIVHWPEPARPLHGRATSTDVPPPR